LVVNEVPRRKGVFQEFLHKIFVFNIVVFLADPYPDFLLFVPVDKPGLRIERCFAIRTDRTVKSALENFYFKGKEDVGDKFYKFVASCNHRNYFVGKEMETGPCFDLGIRVGVNTRFSLGL